MLKDQEYVILHSGFPIYITYESFFKCPEYVNARNEFYIYFQSNSSFLSALIRVDQGRAQTWVNVYFAPPDTALHLTLRSI